MFLRVVGKPFLRALILPVFMLLLSAAMADAVTDWAALKNRIAIVSPAQRAALFTGLIVGWSLVSGRALHRVWHQPVIAYLIRQPISRWQWVIFLFPSVGIALLPVAAIAWLAPQAGLVHYLSFIALAWPIVVGASFNSGQAIVVVLVGALLLFATVFAYSMVPAAAYGALLPAAILMWFSVTPVRAEIGMANRARYSPLSGSGVVTTIARRDFRYLFRRQRKKLFGLLALSSVCSLMMLAFRVNGEQEGREALLSASVLFTVSASGIYEILEALKAGLGKELMRRRWPVTFRQRTWALIALIAILIGPSACLIPLFGSSMGAVNGLIFMLFVCLSVTASAAVFSSRLIVQGTASGIFLLLITGHTALLLALPAWGYAIAAIASVPFTFLLIVRGLGRFTSVTERLSIEQLT